MAGRPIWENPLRSPVAFGRLAIPQMFAELRNPETEKKLQALASLHDLLHDPERMYETVTMGHVEQMQFLLEDEDPSVRSKTCELLGLLCTHNLGRQVLLKSLLHPHPLDRLLDDSSSSCRKNVLHILNLLTLQPTGPSILLRLVPKLLLKLQQQVKKQENQQEPQEGLELEQTEEVQDVKEEEENDEEEEFLLLSLIKHCSEHDALPALSSGAVSVLKTRLTHPSTPIRCEALAAMMVLSIPMAGKQRLFKQEVLPLLVGLLCDKDMKVRINAVGVIMYAVMTTPGKLQCLELNVVPAILDLLIEAPPLVEEDWMRKSRVLYSLRTLTSLAEAPEGRRLLLEQLPLLRLTCEEEEDADIIRAANSAIKVVTWTP